MALPRYDEIHLPLLKLFMNRSIKSVAEAEEILAIEFDLTEEELNKRVNCGTRKFYSQVNFSKMLLEKAGLVEKGTKPYKTTDKAKNVILQNPQKITNRYLNDLAEKMDLDFQKEIKVKSTEFEAYIQELSKIDVTYFEHVVGLILSKVYNVDFNREVEITSPINDGGVDGIIHLSKDNKIYFEAKIRKSPIGERFLRDFVGALEGYCGKIGYFVTTSTFTTPAEKYVNKLKNKEIILIDGYKLVELIFKYKLECEISIN